MKINIFLLFFFFLNDVSGNSKEVLFETKFKKITYVEEIKKYSNEIYCAGFTYDVENRNGYSTDSYLNKYNDSLRLLWSLKISKTSTNKINRILKYNNKLYALVTHGKDGNDFRINNLNLYIITIDGEVERIVNFGSSFSKPTNIIVNNNNLFFGYSEAKDNSISPENIRIPVLLKYNIKTSMFKKLKGTCSASMPKLIITNNSKVYLFGDFISDFYKGTMEQFILSYENGKLEEKLLKGKKDEFFLNSYFIKNQLVYITQFSGRHNDSEKYINYQYFDDNLKKINSKYVPFKDFNCNYISHNVFSTDSSTWLKIDSDTNLSHGFDFLIQLDKNGRLKSIINLEDPKSKTNDFIIDGENQYFVEEKGLKMYHKSILKLSAEVNETKENSWRYWVLLIPISLMLIFVVKLIKNALLPVSVSTYKSSLKL